MFKFLTITYNFHILIQIYFDVPFLPFVDGIWRIVTYINTLTHLFTDLFYLQVIYHRQQQLLKLSQVSIASIKYLIDYNCEIALSLE